jgi:anaerobic ribonucleoside-triphosphate reductase activating protein
VAGAVAYVHGVEERSRANGPGSRFVVWLQGCTLGCPGCFNPATHAPHAAGDGGSRAVPVAQLAAQLASAARPAPGRAPIEGLSLSGGEPLQQAAAAAELLAAARALGLSTLAFSGYTLAEIRALPEGPAVLAQLDVLVDGRYVASARRASGLRGSENQQIHLLTSRYRLAEVEATPVAEIRIDPTGAVVLTGVDPLKLRRR